MPKISINKFNVFKKEVLKWVQLLGLTQYDVHTKHEQLDDTMGQCSYSNQAKWALISLAKETESTVPITEDLVKKIARHEVLELLLSNLRDAACNRNKTEDEVDAVIHEVIQTLLNTVIKGK